MSSQNVPVRVKQKALYDHISRRDLASEFPSGYISTKEQVDRFLRMVVDNCTRVPGLLDCAPALVYAEAKRAARLGLEPSVELGHCSIGIFAGKPTLMIGYRGKVTLAYRHGKIVMDARAVREKDTFQYNEGTDPFIRYEKYLGADDPGPIVCAFAIAKFPDGRQSFRILSERRINILKEAAIKKGRGFSVWNDPDLGEEEMAAKSAIHNLWKMIPFAGDIEVQQAIATDEPSRPFDPKRNPVEDTFGPESNVIDQEDEPDPVTEALDKASEAMTSATKERRPLVPEKEPEYQDEVKTDPEPEAEPDTQQRETSLFKRSDVATAQRPKLIGFINKAEEVLGGDAIESCYDKAGVDPSDSPDDIKVSKLRMILYAALESEG